MKKKHKIKKQYIVLTILAAGILTFVGYKEAVKHLKVNIDIKDDIDWNQVSS